MLIRSALILVLAAITFVAVSARAEEATCTVPSKTHVRACLTQQGNLTLPTATKAKSKKPDAALQKATTEYVEALTTCLFDTIDLKDESGMDNDQVPDRVLEVRAQNKADIATDIAKRAAKDNGDAKHEDTVATARTAQAALKLPGFSDCAKTTLRSVLQVSVAKL